VQLDSPTNKLITYVFFSYLCGWKNYIIERKKNALRKVKALNKGLKKDSVTESVTRLCIFLLRLYGLQKFWVNNMPLLWNLCKK